MALVLDQMPTAHLRVFKRASDGAWLAEGDTNREGIYLYPAEDGSGRMIRELRTADTVRKMTAAVARSVVTMGHPDVEITPDNVASLAHGDVDGGFDIVDQGGFVRGRNRVALRTADAIAAAERGDLKGFSPGYIPIRDNTPGTDPRWGAYDRVLVDVAGVNHLALCGDSDALPPARGGNTVCALYLDSLPRTVKDAPMPTFPKNRAERRAFLRTADARKALDKVFKRAPTKDSAALTIDEIDLNALVAMLQEAMADPSSVPAVVAHAIVNMASEEREIEQGVEPVAEPMDGEMPPALAASMDAKIAALIAPLKATIDALTAEKIARDAAAKNAAHGAFRSHAARLGIKDAATVEIDALVKTAASRLAISIDGLPAEHALSVVASTAALRAADMGTPLPFTPDSTDAVKPAIVGV